MSKCQAYAGLNIDLKRLVDSIVWNYKKKKYDVEISEESYGGPSCAYVIRLTKSGKFRKLVGCRKNLVIVVKGEPDNFQICITSGEWKKNLLSNTITTVPLSAFTFGIPTFVAIGSNMLSVKRSKNDLWAFINDKVDYELEKRPI